MPAKPHFDWVAAHKIDNFLEAYQRDATANKFDGAIATNLGRGYCWPGKSFRNGAQMLEYIRLLYRQGKGRPGFRAWYEARNEIAQSERVTPGPPAPTETQLRAEDRIPGLEQEARDLAGKLRDAQARNVELQEQIAEAKTRPAREETHLADENRAIRKELNALKTKLHDTEFALQGAIQRAADQEERANDAERAAVRSKGDIDKVKAAQDECIRMSASMTRHENKLREVQEELNEKTTALQRAHSKVQALEQRLQEKEEEEVPPPPKREVKAAASLPRAIRRPLTTVDPTGHVHALVEEGLLTEADAYQMMRKMIARGS